MSDGPNTPVEPTPDPTPAPAATKPHPDPAAPKPAVSTTHEKESGVGRVIGTIFHVLIWPLKIMFRPLVFRVSHERGNPKVFFTSFSPLMYMWPIMAMGWFGILTQKIIQPEVLGWAWITVVLIVLITVAADLDRNRALVVAGLVLICWMLGFILESQKNWPVLSDIRDFFARQNVQFDPGTANVFSVVIFIILVGVVIVAWFDGRYEITTREITHKRAFRTSDSLPRAAKRIKRDWRDIAEVFLGLGAGDVIVLDSQKNIVMRIPNVPFLWFFRHDVDHILEVLATTEVEDIAAVMEEDDFS
ncbi:MAG: hypothetical protein H6819_00930 [Phycisphaerales bacterium]|nr:hypothetical protein [Phycisphaerales bacterium]MCB9857228.1 hypothetical protein [Phycisphaerales bacterium]MCB9863058.1 hypothetical protein [Phycisphaerales bacterium]